MFDNGIKTDERFEVRIRLDDPHEVHHWAKVFGVTSLDISIAIRAVGPKPEDVALALGKPWH